MSVLVVQIPPRRRWLSQTQAAADPGTAVEGGAAALPAELFWVRTDSGQTVDAQGQSSPARMPRAEAVVLVMSETDISWHSLTVPRAPTGKMRAALFGTLEENLLTDTEQLHAALAPDAAPGARAWVAVVDKPWLSQALSAFERLGLTVDRVVPPLWPGDRPHGHFFDACAPGQSPEPALAMADANGIVCLPLAGTLARSLLPPAAAKAMRWSAPPAIATAAERWLGEPVIVRSTGEQLLAAARSTWNLRQFDLAPRLRGSLALRDAWRRFMRPAWRPVRLGLLALLALQVFGLNAWAWAHQRAIDARRTAQTVLLKEAHPQVTVVRDPALQMGRETDRLRAAAGQPGASDLETLLAAASAAWPEGQAPAQNLRFQTGQLSLSAAGWSAEDIRRFGERLQPAGWSVASQEGRVTVTRASGR
jgi:general secretion pathway protein L